VIHSDLACPFSYMTEATLARLGEGWRFRLEWEAFEVHQDTPEDGFLVDGDAQRAAYDQLYEQVLWTAAMLGVALNPPARIPNSRCGLAAILALDDRDGARALVLRQRLFESCYVDGDPISTRADVLRVARSCLVPEEVDCVERVLQGDEAAVLVGVARKGGLRDFVNSAPVVRFFPDGEERVELRLRGSQPMEIFERVFDTLGVERR
jgi:predicted DsbA family dithiol-disulfide isomerase